MLTITVLALVPPAITSRPANLLPDVDPGPSSFQLPTPWAMANGNRTKQVGQNLFVPPETPRKRKIFFVLGQYNAVGRGNAARLTEDDQRRLAKVADRVILTYRGGISWPRVPLKDWVGEHGFGEAFGTRGLESKSADKDAADACTVCGTGNNCCGEGGSWGRKFRPWRESTCPSQHTYEEGQAACLELLNASSAQGPSSGASAEQAEGTDAEEDMCPGRPHVRRESANCHSKVDQEEGQTKPE